jgi:polysaccharide biosynthesis protein PslJ
VAIVAGCPLLVWLVLDGKHWLMYSVVGLIAATVGIYVGLRHPLWLYWGLAIAVGFLPFGYFPGVHVPVYLPFAFGAVLAAIIHPSEPGRTRLHSLEIAVLLLMFISGLSLVATGTTVSDVGEFTKWIIATGLIIALLRLSRENMAKFGRIYVYASSFNSLVAIPILLDPQQRLYRVFRPFGYGIGYGREELARYFFSAGGRSARLGGLWVDPNAAGIGLVAALAVCLLVLKGSPRFWFGTVLAVALVLTLSRAALFSVLAGVILVVVFHGMRSIHRLIIVAALSLAAAMCLIIPFIRLRILSSLGSQDSGAVARGEALRDFPGEMAGYWWFGHGWGGKWFKDGSFAYNYNHVANAPLWTTFRGGVFTGLAFALVIIVGCIISYRCLRSNSLPVAIYGGIFIGFVVVALQLDHPVVGIPQSTIAYSILLAFLVYADQSRYESADDSPFLQRHAPPHIDKSAQRVPH